MKKKMSTSSKIWLVFFICMIPFMVYSIYLLGENYMMDVTEFTSLLSEICFNIGMWGCVIFILPLFFYIYLFGWILSTQLGRWIVGTILGVFIGIKIYDAINTPVTEKKPYINEMNKFSEEFESIQDKRLSKGKTF